MKKRILAAVLAALFILSLAGCEIKPQPDRTDTSKEPAESSAPSGEPAETDVADAELLLSFLNGDTEAVVYDDFYESLIYEVDDSLVGAESLSFQELAQLMGSVVDVDEGNWEISYALMETMGGREMLVVRYQGLPGRDGGCYFIFGVYGQEVRLTHTENFWSRSRSELYQNLIFIGDGSGGVGDHFDWCGYIDDEGDYRLVYNVETLYSTYVAMYAYPLFDIMDTDWAEACECRVMTTEEGKFYELHAGAGTDPEKLALLRDYLAQQGMTEIDSVEEAMDQAKEANGVEDTAVFEDWIPWEAEG